MLSSACEAFRVQGSRFRVQGSGFKVQGSGFRVQGSGFRVQGAGCRVQGSWSRVQGSELRVEGFGFGFGAWESEDLPSWKVDARLPGNENARLPGNENANSHGARSVHQIISMIKWIRTSKLSDKKSLSLGFRVRGQPWHHACCRGRGRRTQKKENKEEDKPYPCRDQARKNAHHNRFRTNREPLKSV